MNCRQARTEIALLVGNDLDTAAQQQLERHLAGCPQCREHRAALAACWPALQSATSEPRRTGSLWPRIAAHLERRAPVRAGARFNGWIPAAAVAAAGLVLAFFVQNPRPNDHYLDAGPVTPTAADFAPLPPAASDRRPGALQQVEPFRPSLEFGDETPWSRLRQRDRLQRSVSNEF